MGDIPNRAQAIRDALATPRDVAERSATRRSLRRRRSIAALSAVGLMDATAVGLRQLGVLSRLPDPPGRMFDSDAVTTSRAAFVFRVPDATLATAQHALTFIAAGAGGTRRTGRSRLWAGVLLGNVLAGAIGGAGYLWNMFTRQKRLCAYCLLASSVNFALVPLAAIEAWHMLRTRRDS